MESLVIDIEKLEELGISADEYTLLFLLFNELSVPLRYKSYLEQLEALDWLKIAPDSIILKNKALNLFKKETIDEFIIRWTELWPDGIKNQHGQYIKSDIETIKSKFSTFFKKYKKYSKEDIMIATQSYLIDKKKVNWNFAIIDHYFIYKQGISTLASCIENLNKREESYDFHTQI